MKVEAVIQKWGNGLALRVSGVMREVPHFKVGTKVDVEVNEKGFIVTKHKLQKKLLPFTEAQLLKDLTPELMHTDLLAQLLAGEFDDNQ